MSQRSPRARASCTLFAAVLLLAACARVVVEPEADYCLTWVDLGASPGAAAIPADAACHVTAKWPNAKVVPSTPDARLAYVCVPAPPEGDCPAPALAEPAASTCLESETGNICGGAGFGGECTSEKIWSMCGPDASAEGGCCYWAYVVTSTVWS